MNTIPPVVTTEGVVRRVKVRPDHFVLDGIQVISWPGPGHHEAGRPVPCFDPSGAFIGDATPAAGPDRLWEWDPDRPQLWEGDQA